MTVSKKLIENVEELRKALNEISVYDFDVYTSMELYYKIANKLNEVIKELMRFEGVVSDEVIKQNEKLIYLLGEGLNIEVVKKINQMVQDGTMDSIINHNVFNSLNNKIDNFKEELSSQIKEKANLTGINLIDYKTNENTWDDALTSCFNIGGLINFPYNDTIDLSRNFSTSENIIIYGNNCRINYNGEGQFLNFKNHAEIHNIKIYYNGEKNKEVSCIKSDNEGWGNKLILNNVSIINFTRNYITLKDNFKSIFNNVLLSNWTEFTRNKRIAINFDTNTDFNNCISLNSVTINGVDIALRFKKVSDVIVDNLSLDHVNYAFVSEEGTLVENINIQNSWFEDVETLFAGGVVNNNTFTKNTNLDGIPRLMTLNNNHKIRVTNITPKQSPVNFSSLDMWVNDRKKLFETDEITDITSQKIDLFGWKYGKNTTWKNLFTVTTQGVEGELPLKSPIETDKLNSETFNFTGVEGTSIAEERTFILDLTNMFTKNGTTRRGTLVFNVTVTDIGGNDGMNAIFLMSDFSNTYFSNPVLLGEIYDRWDKGVDYKLKMTRNQKNKVNLILKTKEFKKVSVGVNFLTF